MLSIKIITKNVGIIEGNLYFVCLYGPVYINELHHPPSITLPTCLTWTYELWSIINPHFISLDFSTNKLGFTPEFLGRVKLVTSVASLIGVALYNTFLKKVPLRKIFLLTTITGSALGMTQVHTKQFFSFLLTTTPYFFCKYNLIYLKIISRSFL